MSKFVSYLRFVVNRFYRKSKKNCTFGVEWEKKE